MQHRQSYVLTCAWVDASDEYFGVLCIDVASALYSDQLGEVNYIIYSRMEL